MSAGGREDKFAGGTQGGGGKLFGIRVPSAHKSGRAQSDRNEKLPPAPRKRKQHSPRAPSKSHFNENAYQELFKYLANRRVFVCLIEKVSIVLLFAFGCRFFF